MRYGMYSTLDYTGSAISICKTISSIQVSGTKIKTGQTVVKDYTRVFGLFVGNVLGVVPCLTALNMGVAVETIDKRYTTHVEMWPEVRK